MARWTTRIQPPLLRNLLEPPWNRRKITVFRPQRHKGRVEVVAFRPDGRPIARAHQNKTVRLRDPHSDLELPRLAGMTDRYLSVSLIPGARRVAGGGGSGR